MPPRWSWPDRFHYLGLLQRRAFGMLALARSRRCRRGAVKTSLRSRSSPSRQGRRLRRPRGREGDGRRPKLTQRRRGRGTYDSTTGDGPGLVCGTEEAFGLPSPISSCIRKLAAAVPVCAPCHGNRDPPWLLPAPDSAGKAHRRGSASRRREAMDAPARNGRTHRQRRPAVVNRSPHAWHRGHGPL